MQLCCLTIHLSTFLNCPGIEHSLAYVARTSVFFFSLFVIHALNFKTLLHHCYKVAGYNVLRCYSHQSDINDIYTYPEVQTKCNFQTMGFRYMFYVMFKSELELLRLFHILLLYVKDRNIPKTFHHTINVVNIILNLQWSFPQRRKLGPNYANEKDNGHWIPSLQGSNIQACTVYITLMHTPICQKYTLNWHISAD